MFQDVRFALRQFAARPLFTLTAVATLALGIGASTAIFGVVNGVLLKPLPYADSDRLAYVFRASPRDELLMVPTGELVEAWRQGGRSFSALEAWSTGQTIVRTGSSPRAMDAAAISHGLPAMLGLAPALGREFTRDDEAAGASPVAMLSYALWQAEYGGAAGAIGRTITVDGTAHQIVGVAPPQLGAGIESLERTLVWLPLRRNAEGRYAGDGIHALLRLRDGVDPQPAADELTAIGARALEPGDHDGLSGVRLMTPQDMLGHGFRRTLLLLMGAVALVLLIACANVAHLLLVRATAREQELAVRVALGAGRGRIVRQLFVESLVLGLAGGAAGLVLSYWGLDAMLAIRPGSVAELERVRIDGRVTTFAALLALGTTLLFGLLPALRAARDAALHGIGSRTVAGARRTRRMAGALIAAEVALSLLLLMGAGLLVRTFIELRSRPIGFEPAGLWTATVELPPTEPGEQRDDRAFYRGLRDAVVTLPNVRSAHLAVAVPPDYGVSFGALGIDGQPPADDAPSLFASNFVEPDYFQALRTRFVEGRAFTADDGPDVVVVAESFARRFFEGPAVGHTIRLGDSGEWRTIVGVVADLPAQGFASVGGGFHQLHFPPGPFTLRSLVVDSDVDAAALAPAIRRAAADLDPDAALADFSTIESLLAGSLHGQRFNFILLLTLAAMAMLLSAVGLYGVVGVAVAARTREIGIRRALGASRASIVRLALREGLRPALAGLAIGFTASLGLTRLLDSMLYGLSPHDPLTLATGPLLLALVAAFASWLPSRRAARLELVEALRIEG